MMSAQVRHGFHELAHDFRLEDVWAVPGFDAEGDVPLLVQLIASFDPSRSSSIAVRSLFAVRRKIGTVLGWDSPGTGLGSRVTSMRTRLRSDLRDQAPGPEFEVLPLTSLYLLEDEWAGESANKTVHGVIHIARVPDENGAYHTQLAVYVKPNGLLGTAYMLLIRPFRHLLVYPAILQELERVQRGPSVRD